MNDTAVVHIVRRYGRVGGMENYVWELTHALAELGVKVEIICEQLYDSPSKKMQIHLTKVNNSSSRWKGMMYFRDEVKLLITGGTFDRKIIIHSHERSLIHHITTFHGPPMEVKSDWWRLSSLSSRIKAWKAMEKDEILGSQVQFVLPVSKQIENKLRFLYPDLAEKRIVIAYPGVHELKKIPTARKSEGKGISRFLFVGKEWNRKGLRFAIKVIQSYSSDFGPCVLDVYGPAASSLPSYVQKNPNVVIRGWSTEIPWEEYDALIHPATNEPFGMVVTEARRHGVPVLTTNLVGSVELGYHGVVVLDGTETSVIWAQNLFKLTHDDKNRKPEVKWTWQDLALLHLNEIYSQVNN